VSGPASDPTPTPTDPDAIADRTEPVADSRATPEGVPARLRSVACADEMAVPWILATVGFG
jgi:hypothetical protein